MIKKKSILDLSPKGVSQRAGKASREAVDRLITQGICVVEEDGTVRLKNRMKRQPNTGTEHE